MNRLFVALFVAVAILVGIFVHYHRKNVQRAGQYADQYCRADTDCKKGERCIIDATDARQNVCAEAHMQKCVFSDFSKLSRCDPKDPNACKGCINQPPFGCVVVNFGKPEILNPGRVYTSGIYTAALYDPLTGLYDTERTMEVLVNVLDWDENGFVDSVRISNPVQVYKQNDTFLILGGNKEATFYLTEQPTPYFWQKGRQKITLPESESGKGWCLPPIVEGAKCNPYTADSLLVQNVDDKGKTTYSWGCYCKMPSLMQHDNTPSSNCSALVGCSGYDLYIPPPMDAAQTCTSNAQCLQANTRCCSSDKCLKTNTESFPSTSPGKCLSRWTLGDTARNPRLGTCDCPTGTYYLNTTIGDYVTKTCSVDPCGEAGVKTPGTFLCECKPGFVSCGVTPSNNVEVTDARCASTTTVNRCIPDPCAPGGVMKRGGGCTCNKGYTQVKDDNAVGGYSCKELCNPGPCGERGTCTVDTDGKESCVCKSPWVPSGPNDKLCLSKKTECGMTIAGIWVPVPCADYVINR